jgi:hypothetical protein
LFTARNQLIADGTQIQEVNTAFFKNGAIAKTGMYIYTPSNPLVQWGAVNSSVIYCNGTTDYVECYARSDGSTLYISGAGAPYSYFQGTLQRTA